MKNRWRYAKRKDVSHPGIVDALKAVGATIEPLESDSKRGIPDLLVGFRGRTYLLEVKRPAHIDQRKRKNGIQPEHRQAGKLSEDQERWHQRWTGGPVDVVETPTEALRAIGIPIAEGSLP
jgi:hypothetical protein